MGYETMSLSIIVYSWARYLEDQTNTGGFAVKLTSVLHGMDSTKCWKHPFEILVPDDTVEMHCEVHGTSLRC